MPVVETKPLEIRRRMAATKLDRGIIVSTRQLEIKVTIQIPKPGEAVKRVLENDSSLAKFPKVE